jgi:predicted hotdog family 3-hydroxylacyl-ACP dehydratase
MVDTLLSCDSANVVAQFKVSAHAIFVENGQLSETGLIEHMAQTVALHAGYEALRKKSKPVEGFIGAIKEVTIVRCPKIGEIITTEVEIIYEALAMTQVQIISRIDKHQIATATMTTVLKVKEN